MYLNAQLENVEGRTGGMFIGSWTPVMPSPQVAFIGMQKTVGVMRQLRQQMACKIWRLHAWSWPRQSCMMGQLQPSLNVLERGK